MLAAMATPGIPNGSKQMLNLVLLSIDLEPCYALAIMPIYSLVYAACPPRMHTPCDCSDRFITVVNINGDAYVAAMVERVCLDPPRVAISTSNNSHTTRNAQRSFELHPIVGSPYVSDHVSMWPFRVMPQW
jgi:Na+/H+-dicarboxylate symporter